MNPNDPEQLEAAADFAGDLHDHLRDSILLADQKAGFLFATVTAVLAYLHSNGATQTWLASVKSGQWNGREVVLTLAIVGLVLGALSALLVVVPRIRGSSTGIVASWHIAAFDSPQAYTDRVLRTEPEQLVQARLEHCWILARINSRKYQYINVAVRIAAVGLVSALLYLVLS